MTRRAHPFPAGPNVNAYVRRPELEDSIAYLTAKLGEPGWLGVSGAPGVGKTLLLRLLASRLRDRFQAVYVPTADLTPEELLRWARSAAGLCDERPLLLLIDEAQQASPRFVAWLEEFCKESSGPRAILAWTETDESRAPAHLMRCRTRVFVEPLELADVSSYIEAQLLGAEAPAGERIALAAATRERIALASAGNPRMIQRLADAVLAAHVWRTRGSARAPVSAPSGRAATSRVGSNTVQNLALGGWLTTRLLAITALLFLAAAAWVSFG